MRVRIRRFEKWRLRGQPGDAKLVDVRLRQHAMDRQGRVIPPALRSESHGPRQVVGRTERPTLPVDRGTQPAKECGPDPRGAHARPPAPTSRSTRCASRGCLRPGLRRTLTSKPAHMLGAPLGLTGAPRGDATTARAMAQRCRRMSPLSARPS